MKIADFSIKHPVIITMLLIVLAVFGLYSLNDMPTAFMTNVTMPQAVIYTVYPGASAEDVEQDVTKILEDAFVTLPNFKSIESASYSSISFVTGTYRDGVDPNDQLEELRNRIRELKSQLPDGISGEPHALVGGMSMLPIITFSIDAGKDEERTARFIEQELTPRLTQINGVSNISTEGGRELQVNIKLRTDDLTARGISVSQVYQILNYGNVSLPLGTADHQSRTIQVRYQGGFASIDDIANLPVGVADGTTIIHLSDVADISYDYAKSDYHVSNGKTPLTLVSVTKRTDGDTVTIIKKIKKILKNLEEENSGAVKFHIISDDSRSVSASLKTVITSGIMGIIFAVLVILLFMADWRATLTIGLSIPLCILFSFIGLRLFDMSLNLMSFSGLVISLGMVVDGSTVMLDQIYRYYKERTPDGKLAYTVNQSIYRGWDEVAGSILASTATTMVVFIPMALLTGLIGNILNAVSITILVAIGSSFIVALIIVPYLLKLLLKDEGPAIPTKPRTFDVFMDKLEDWYRGVLEWALNKRKTIIAFSIFLLVFSGVIALRLGIAFIPSTDAGEFYISVDFPIGTTIEQTEAKMDLAQKLLYDYVPEIDSIVLYTGQSQNKGIMTMAASECAYAHVILVPVAERKRGVHEIMLQMQEIWPATLPDAKVTLENGGFDKLMGYVSGSGYGITLQSENLELLYETACKIRDQLETHPDVTSATLNSNFDTSTMIIDMSQEYLSSLGLTSYQAGITSAILFQGMDCGKFKDNETGRRYNIRLFSDITDKSITSDDIANVHIVTDQGQDISFAALSDIYVEKSISQINRKNRAKVITVSANLVSENTANVSQFVNDYLAKNPLPSGVASAPGGVMALIRDMITPMVTALLIAIFLVYTVMVIQFEKFKQPLLIMATVPFCFIGVVLGLMMFGSTMNLLAMLGIVSLSGVVVNSAIILVDYINLLRKQKKEELARQKGKQNRDGEWEITLSDDEENQLLRDCIIKGSASRIRPILITTLTTLLGDIPMAISKGEGAEIYAPMGQAIVGGLITSTLITLVLIPVLYYMVEKKKTKKLLIKEE